MKDTIITLTRRWTQNVEGELQTKFTGRLNIEDKPLDAGEIINRCQDATVLCPTVSDVIDGYLIARLPESVRLIANYGVGVEHIDVVAASERGIIVSNTPDVVVDDTADLAVGLILAASRRFSEADAFLREGLWENFSLGFMLGSSVHGKVLGIIGMGDIGTAVARRVRGFNMKILYHNRHRNQAAEEELGATYCEELETLLRQADIITLHCPLTPETKHIINEKTLQMMKSTAILVNTARGPVVDQTALVSALENGVITAAGLDVYENEPVIPEALSRLKNTILIPHLGTATHEARDAMGFRVIENIVSYLKFGEVKDPVKL